MFVELISALKS